jgi:hypothetical protein
MFAVNMRSCLVEGGSTEFMGYGSPFCYEACAEQVPGSNQFCCADGFASLECKADSGPICDGCQ